MRNKTEKIKCNSVEKPAGTSQLESCVAQNESNSESEDDDGFFNVINDEEQDSSDSERDDHSENELDAGSDDDSEENEEASDEEEQEEDENGSDEASEDENGSDEASEDDAGSNESDLSDDEYFEADEYAEADEDAEADDSEEADSDVSTGEVVNNDSEAIKTRVHRQAQSETTTISKSAKVTELTANRKPVRSGQSRTVNTADAFRKRTKKRDVLSAPSTNDEYAEHDTSDEEDIRNTVGNVPMKWYDDYKHLGYDWDGKQILKPESGDHIDNFLKRMDDPDFWRTVKDPQTGQGVVLAEEDIALIRRIQGQKIPDVTFDDYAPWIEWFTSEVMKTPLRKFPEHKRSFLPSKNEAKKVSKLVHALKMGWIKTKAEQDRLRAHKDPQFYMLWQTDDQAEEMRRIHKHIAAPKRHLPGHAESYNPPPEYLFDDKEMKEWNKLETAPLKRKLHFVPQKYDSLRRVPAYSRFIKERFLRCLDLYLCPRAIKMKLTIEPEALVPKLPSPRDLQPFPTVLAVQYEGHADMVRCMSTDKYGQYLVTGSDDTTLKIWEVNTGRCLKTVKTEGVVRSVEWCPNSSISLILAASGNRVLLINPHVGDFVVSSKTDAVLKEAPQGENIVNERVRTSVQWEEPAEGEYSQGFRMVVKHFKEVNQVAWHGKGDYFATVMPDGQNRSVLISQLSRRRSQLPFSKSKGLVQCVLFHPIRPLLFVATQRHVRIYDLVKQQLVKKLMTNSRWISTMDVHPGGDNLLVATYDRKILWFDLDLSTKPYQTLRLHGTAVRGVAFHKRYPLFASGSDDRSLIISHGMVYNDLLKNPLIVPLKRFQDHVSANDFGIFGVRFHPLQPWVFSSGADGTVKLYSN